MSERGVPVPWTKQARPSRSKNGCISSADFLHELEVGEQDEGLAVGELDEMLDPVDERVAIAFGARVGHLADDVELHLALVIEGRADLQQRGRLGADAMGEVVQAGVLACRAPCCVLRGAWCVDSPTEHAPRTTPETDSVALVMMTEVSLPKRRRRR